MEQGGKPDQIVHGRQRIAILPLVYRLRSVESERRLQIFHRHSGILSQIRYVRPGLRQVYGWEDHFVSPHFP